MKLSKLLERLNEIEDFRQSEIKEIKENMEEIFGERTDDAETYIGMIHDKADKEIDYLIEEYDTEDVVFFHNGKFVDKRGVCG